MSFTPLKTLLIADVENIQVNQTLEKLLSQSFENRQKLDKIAFASWGNISNDITCLMYNSGWDLRHVPQGKDAADFAILAYLKLNCLDYSEIFLLTKDGLLVRAALELLDNKLTILGFNCTAGFLYSYNFLEFLEQIPSPPVTTPAPPPKSNEKADSDLDLPLSKLTLKARVQNLESYRTKDCSKICAEYLKTYRHKLSVDLQSLGLTKKPTKYLDSLG